MLDAGLSTEWKINSIVRQNAHPAVNGPFLFQHGSSILWRASCNDETEANKNLIYNTSNDTLWLASCVWKSLDVFIPIRPQHNSRQMKDREICGFSKIVLVKIFVECWRLFRTVTTFKNYMYNVWPARLKNRTKSLCITGRKITVDKWWQQFMSYFPTFPLFIRSFFPNEMRIKTPSDFFIIFIICIKYPVGSFLSLEEFYHTE